MLTTTTFHKILQELTGNSDEPGYLLAVSGGADSMVLLHLFHECKLKFEVAHVNYKLRAEASDIDQKLVENYCLENGLTFHLYEVSEKDQKPENSIQLWARNLRYRFFRKIQETQKLQYLVTAHHLNDQLETFLINLSRGAGIKGLSGIPANENLIIRPLLKFSKNEIYDFASENNVAFREDASNQKNDYLRNKIRNKVLPEIEKTSGDFLERFSDSIGYLNSANSFIQKNVNDSFSEILKSSDEHHFLLDKEKLFKKDPFVVSEIIRRLGFSGIEIDKIINADNGKFFRSKTHEISLTRTEIICTRKV